VSSTQVQICKQADDDAMGEGDMGPDCDKKIIAAGGIFVKE
jgi:hypothetical protein